MTRHLRPAAALAALGLAATFSIAAHAPEGCYVAIEGDPATEDDDVIACEEQTWFHGATTLAGNVGYVDPSGTHGLATFDTNPPAGSVTGGNGAGYIVTGANIVDGTAPTRATFSGTHTGVLDRMDIDLHVLADFYEVLDEVPVYDIGLPMSFEIHVDGAPVFRATNIRTDPVVEEASAAGSKRIDLAITGLAERLALVSFENGPETVHTVELVVQPGGSDQATILAFDTTEVPGGIGFNRVEIPQGTIVVDAG